MINGKKVFAIIGARGGSKSIPGKNVIDLGGFPLIAYSIAAAKLSKYIDRVVVSTDDKEIAQVAKKYGAEVPFMRPKEFATDTSTDIEFVKHFLDWLKENEDMTPDYIVHLRPTTPLRGPKIVDEAIEKLDGSKEATSLRSAHELNEPPQKYFRLDDDYFRKFLDSAEDPNAPRQLFPTAYHPDGYVDVLIPKYIISSGELHGDKILAFVTPNTGEIDGPEDLNLIRFMINDKDWEIYKYLKDNFKD